MNRPQLTTQCEPDQPLNLLLNQSRNGSLNKQIPIYDYIEAGALKLPIDRFESFRGQKCQNIGNLRSYDEKSTK